MTKTVISLKTWAPHGPILLAKSLGYLEQIPVELHLSEDETEKEKLFINGEIDVLATTLDYVPFLAESVPEVRFFLKLGESAGADAIVAINTIRSSTDLQGKTVALEPPGVSQLLLKEYMERGGLKYSDVAVKEITHDRAPEELGQNDVVAVVTWEPYVQQALQKVSGSHILLTSKQTPGVIVEGLVARNSFISARKHLLVDLTREYFRSMDYIEDHVREAREAMALAFDIPETELRQMLDTVILADKQDNLRSFTVRGTQSPLQETYDLLRRLWFEENLTSKLGENCVDNDIVLSATK